MEENTLNQDYYHAVIEEDDDGNAIIYYDMENKTLVVDAEGVVKENVLNIHDIVSVLEEYNMRCSIVDDVLIIYKCQYDQEYGWGDKFLKLYNNPITGELRYRNIIIYDRDGTPDSTLITDLNELIHSECMQIIINDRTEKLYVDFSDTCERYKDKELLPREDICNSDFLSVSFYNIYGRRGTFGEIINYAIKSYMFDIDNPNVRRTVNNLSKTLLIEEGVIKVACLIN